MAGTPRKGVSVKMKILKNNKVLIVLVLLASTYSLANMGIDIAGVVSRLVMTTVFSSTYDTATPAGTDSPTEADDRMRETKAAVQERENVDHYWPLTGTEVSDADSGEHRKITFHETIADPSQDPSHAHLYMQADELRYQDDTNSAFDITSGGKIEGANLKDDSIDADAIEFANNTFLTQKDSGGTARNLIGMDGSDITHVGDAAAHDVRLTDATVGGDNDLHLADKKYVDDTAGTVIQLTSSFSGAIQTGTTQVPFDDTIPQITEGDEYYTVAITPVIATSKLVIEASITMANTGSNQYTIALFQDATADALACTSQSSAVAAQMITMHLRHVMTSGTDSSTTFRIRSGSSAVGTTTVNGVSAGNRRYGGALSSGIVVTEIN